jgi:hypothetical protein
MIVLRKSQWELKTSAGAGVGFGAFNNEAGMFALNAPTHQSYKYRYSGFGMGWSRGLSSLLRIPAFALPKVVIRNDELTGAGSTTDFTSGGRLFVTSAFKGIDLVNPESLEGGTVYLEGAAGYLLGGTGSFMLLGINTELLLLGIRKPDVIGMAIRSAPAALVIAGVNEGIQDTTGFAFMLGQVSYKGLYSDDAS